MSDSVRPHGWPPTRFRCPWDSPVKNIGVDCHFLLQCMKVKNESLKDLSQKLYEAINFLFCFSLCTLNGEGNGTPLQYSCLENPMEGGAWKAAVHGVAEGQT